MSDWLSSIKARLAATEPFLRNHTLGDVIRKWLSLDGPDEHAIFFQNAALDIAHLLAAIEKKDEALKYYTDEIIFAPDLMLSDGAIAPQSHWAKVAREALAFDPTKGKES